MQQKAVVEAHVVRHQHGAFKQRQRAGHRLKLGASATIAG